MEVVNPVIGFAMIVVILNLGAPLDYHLIFGAGIYTAVYILARAAGKYSGAYLGAAVTHAPAAVRRYLGLTLLPHSGVSLGVHRHRRVGAAKCGAGICLHAPGDHCGRGGDQRGDRRICGQEGL